MADIYSRKLLRVVVAQLSQAIGWHSIQSTPLELMTDVLTRYLEELGKLMHRYAEQFGHTDPNLDDVGLAFRDMGINMHELEEYIRNVDCVACSFEIPKFPIPRDSHLNFLKPGSREVVTRPVHVHEHLPPMHPEMEEEDYATKQTPLSVDITPTSAGSSSPLSSPKSSVFKRPGDPVSVENAALKRARLVLEEEGRPLREISSVMMTTSGFLSPAREGKLPESRTPLQPSDSRSNSPQPSSYPMVPPEVKGEKKYKKGPLKRTVDGIKKLDKENKKKEHKTKALVQQDHANLSDDSRVKKLVSMKELSKLKALKPGALKMMAQGSMSGPSTSARPKPTSKISSVKSLQTASPKNVKTANQAKAASAAAAATTASTTATTTTAGSTTSSSSITAAAAATSAVAATTTAVAATSTASSRVSPASSEKVRETSVVEGKLLAEPDRQKLNIFKKISKVKEDKADKVDRLEFVEAPPRDSRESSPGLVIDESEVNSRQREARMAQIEDCIDAVIQRSMEISETPNKPKTPLGPSVVEDSAKVQYLPADSSSLVADTNMYNDVYMFDEDLFPPGTPSTPKTPELPISVSKGEKGSEPREQKEKKKKKDKSKSKKEPKSKAKGSASPKKIKTEVVDVAPDWPKTPEGPEPSESASAPVFPFFPHFQPAPGLIPPPIAHPLFQRFPLPIGKNLPHPAMPNLPMPPPLFMQPRPEDPVDGKDKSADKSPEKPPVLVPPGPVPGMKEKEREKEKEKDKEKEKGPLAAAPLPEKKLGDKKPKEHKKEKRDKEKAKKKKERKEKLKNKDKEEKKKTKAEKKEKDKEKIKEKKEKKEKKKDKEREDKSEGGVPKITFKLGPASPRPPTPDAALRKIVIKPVLKKQFQGQEEECEKGVASPSTEMPLKREPSPELARISALITRPPRQKASSKTSFLKQESPADGFPTSSQPSLPPCTSVICAPPLPAVPTSPSSPVSTTGSAPSPVASTGAGSTPAATKVKKALKPISKPKARDVVKKSGADAEPHKDPIAFYYDNEGKKVWFCPACGGQDDGSPMIGCDDCDAWYHWVCVGIQVPPDENEDWYCRVCIVKKQEHIVDKKKKSRKRKMLT